MHKVNPGHDLKRLKGLSQGMNFKAGIELPGVKSPKCYLNQ